jgi:hypothetical protein
MSTTTTDNIMGFVIPETGATDKNRYATYINAWPQKIENYATNDFFSVRIEGAVTEKTYTLIQNLPRPGKITQVTSISASGTCTATTKVNSTALGGTANSVSSAENIRAHVATNTWVSGDDLKVTISSNTACTDVNLTYEVVWTGYT